MAQIYVRSTDGSNADNGSTWALAKATLAGADAIDTSGDQINLSSIHSESTAGNVTLSCLSGSWAGATRILSVNDAAAPPTTLAAGAVVACTNTATSMKIFSGNGGTGYVYGVTFQAGNAGSSRVDLEIGPNAAAPGDYYVRFEQCTFHLNTTNAVGLIYVPSNNGTTDKSSFVEWVNCYVKFGNAGHNVFLEGSFRWNGGGAAAGGTSPTNIFNFISATATTTTVGGPVLVENCDFSNFSSTVNICATPNVRRVSFVIRNCKLPASWSGNLVAAIGTMSSGTRVEMYNCAAGATNYALWITDFIGEIKHETTVVRTGGANDGVTSFSWKMSTQTGRAGFDSNPLVSPELSIYNSTTGSAKTLTVEMLTDSLTNLKNDEVWLEVNYLGSSATPIATRITSAKADTLATAADITASSTTWTTTGLTNPNKQKMAVTFTPQMKGWFHCKVMFAKSAATIYIDPKIAVT